MSVADEIMQRLGAFIPNFLNDLVEIICGPKTFLESIDLRTKKSIPRAAAFFCICMLAYFIVELTFVTRWKQDASLKLISLMAIYSSVFVVEALALKMSWNMVSGQAPIRTLTVFYAYVYGMLKLIDFFQSFIFLSLAKLIDPGAFAFFVGVQDYNALFEFAKRGELPATAVIVTIGYFVGAIASLIWMLVIWGAFRKINEVGKTRSVIAFILFYASSAVLEIAGVNMAIAL